MRRRVAVKYVCVSRGAAPVYKTPEAVCAIMCDDQWPVLNDIKLATACSQATDLAWRLS